MWLNKYHFVPVAIYAGVLYATLGTFGLIWGFLVSTVLLWHGTFTINSFSHVFGKRRYATTDDSRNNWFLALLTMGEGWHNNHHYYQSTANQGFYWWEIDLSYYILLALSKVGLIWDLRKPAAVGYRRRARQASAGCRGAPGRPRRRGRRSRGVRSSAPEGALRRLERGS